MQQPVKSENLKKDKTIEAPAANFIETYLNGWRSEKIEFHNEDGLISL